MTVSLPSAEDLDDAMSRGYVRERIAAAQIAHAMLRKAELILTGAEARLLHHEETMGLLDIIDDVETRIARLQEALDTAMGLEQQRAPRRADPEMLARVRAAE